MFIRRSTTSVSSSPINNLSCSTDGNLSESQISSTSEVSEECDGGRQTHYQQNREKWKNLAKIYERYQLSNHAETAVAISVLQNFGIISENDMPLVIDKNKLCRERQRYKKTRARKLEFC